MGICTMQEKICVSKNHKDDYHAQGCYTFQHVKDKKKKKTLCNPLSNDKKTLDSSTVQDLLNMIKVGIDRMERFICQYILPLPTTGSRKHRKKSHKLATFTHKPSTKQENKRESKSSRYHKSAMEILQTHGITAVLIH